MDFGSLLLDDTCAIRTYVPQCQVSATVLLQKPHEVAEAENLSHYVQFESTQASRLKKQLVWKVL